MAIDNELERLLEELDSAMRRRETRLPLIAEALDELPHATTITFDNYLGFGRQLPVNDAVRSALHEAAQEERDALDAAVEEAREAVIVRRSALAAL